MLRAINMAVQTVCISFRVVCLPLSRVNKSRCAIKHQTQHHLKTQYTAIEYIRYRQGILLAVLICELCRLVTLVILSSSPVMGVELGDLIVIERILLGPTSVKQIFKKIYKVFLVQVLYNTLHNIFYIFYFIYKHSTYDNYSYV